ncbi:E3 ubiquitin-protein ligase TRIM33-like isoform X3 [Tachypleus tridentatus]|uniref:E3 ubiquitin-protein ligase TRIM33-like isoform X3 n=1 Tax=Tachypleus tridentatus TaxID=6853 RepID=UPI003FD5334F
MENNDNNSMGEVEQVSGNETPEWVDSKCVFCKQELKERNEPRLLPCLHGACKACVSAESVLSPASVSTYSTPVTKPVTCPACNEEINPGNAIDHLFILENVAQANESLEGCEKRAPCCTSCEDSAPASGFCTDCQEWLCEMCIQAHQRVKVTKDHSVRPRDDMEGEKTSGLDQKYLFCPLHSKEPLKLYCESCDKLTCRDCQLLEHKDHKYQFLSAACEQHKLYLSTLLTKIKEKQKYIENARSLISKRQDEVTEREKEVTQEIKMFAVKFITEINRRGKLLLQELNEVCSQKKKQLTMKNEELVNLSQRLYHCQRFAESVINKGSDIALVYSKKALTNQLRHVLRRRCEVPNPQHMVDIKFAYESQFLSEYISHLGCLMVDQQPVGGMFPAGIGRGQQGVNTSLRMQTPSVTHGPQPRGMIPSQGGRPPGSYGNVNGTNMSVRSRGPVMGQPLNKGYPQQQVSSSTHSNLAGHSPVQLRNLLSTSQQQGISPRSNQTTANWQQCMPGNQVRVQSPQMVQQTRPYPVQLRQANSQAPPSPSQPSPSSVALSLPVSLNSNITISPVKTPATNNRQSHVQAQRSTTSRTNSQPNQQKSIPLATPNLPPGLQILPHPAPRQPSPSQVIVIDDDPAPVTTTTSTVTMSHARNMVNTSRLSHFSPGNNSSPGTVNRVSHPPSHDNRMHSSPIITHIANRTNGRFSSSSNPLPSYIVPSTTINTAVSLHGTTPSNVSLSTPQTAMVQSQNRTAGIGVQINGEDKSSGEQMPTCSGQGYSPKEESIVDAASRILSEFANQSIGSILKDEDKGTTDDGSPGEKSKESIMSLTSRKEGRRGSTVTADSSSSPVPVVTIDDDQDTPVPNPIIVSVTGAAESVLTAENHVKETSSDEKNGSDIGVETKNNSKGENKVKNRKGSKELNKKETDEVTVKECQEKNKTESEETNSRDSSEISKRDIQEKTKRDPLKKTKKEPKEKVKRESQEKTRRDSQEQTKKDSVEKSRRESQETSKSIDSQKQSRRESQESSSSNESTLKIRIKKEKLNDITIPKFKIKKEKIDNSPKEISKEKWKSEENNRSLLEDLQSLEDLLKTSSSGLTVSEVRVNSNGLEISKVGTKSPNEEINPLKDAVAKITKTFINGQGKKELSMTVSKNVGKNSNHSVDDPNEDWCAVCHDGGELLCCSNCPRVYHLNCHVPALLTTPNEDWACLMCTDIINGSLTRDSGGSKRKNPLGLSGHELTCCEKILLELFCHEASIPFHEPVSKTQVPNYYKVITKPIDMLTIKQKLSPNHFNHYRTVDELTSDIHLIFSNCFTFNPEGSSLYNAAKILKVFFCDLLKKYLPEYNFELTTPSSEDLAPSDGETSKAKRQCKELPNDTMMQY